MPTLDELKRQEAQRRAQEQAAFRGASAPANAPLQSQPLINTTGTVAYQPWIPGVPPGELGIPGKPPEEKPPAPVQPLPAPPKKEEELSVGPGQPAPAPAPPPEAPREKPPFEISRRLPVSEEIARVYQQALQTGTPEVIKQITETTASLEKQGEIPADKPLFNEEQRLGLINMLQPSAGSTDLSQLSKKELGEYAIKYKNALKEVYERGVAWAAANAFDIEKYAKEHNLTWEQALNELAHSLDIDPEKFRQLIKDKKLVEYWAEKYGLDMQAALLKLAEEMHLTMDELQKLIDKRGLIEYYQKSHHMDINQAWEVLAGEFDLSVERLKDLVKEYKADPHADTWDTMPADFRFVLAGLAGVVFNPETEYMEYIRRNYIPVGTNVSPGNWQHQVIAEYAKEHDMTTQQALELINKMRDFPNDKAIKNLSEFDRQALSGVVQRLALGGDYISKQDLERIQASDKELANMLKKKGFQAYEAALKDKERGSLDVWSRDLKQNDPEGFRIFVEAGGGQAGADAYNTFAKERDNFTEPYTTTEEIKIIENMPARQYFLATGGRLPPGMHMENNGDIVRASIDMFRLVSDINDGKLNMADVSKYFGEDIKNSAKNINDNYMQIPTGEWISKNWRIINENGKEEDYTLSQLAHDEPRLYRILVTKGTKAFNEALNEALAIANVPIKRQENAESVLADWKNPDGTYRVIDALQAGMALVKRGQTPREESDARNEQLRIIEAVETLFTPEQLKEIKYKYPGLFVIGSSIDEEEYGPLGARLEPATWDEATAQVPPALLGAAGFAKGTPVPWDDIAVLAILGIATSIVAAINIVKAEGLSSVKNNIVEFDIKKSQAMLEGSEYTYHPGYRPVPIRMEDIYHPGYPIKPIKMEDIYLPGPTGKLPTAEEFIERFIERFTAFNPDKTLIYLPGPTRYQQKLEDFIMISSTLVAVADKAGDAIPEGLNIPVDYDGVLEGIQKGIDERKLFNQVNAIIRKERKLAKEAMAQGFSVYKNKSINDYLQELEFYETANEEFRRKLKLWKEAWKQYIDSLKPEPVGGTNINPAMKAMIATYLVQKYRDINIDKTDRSNYRHWLDSILPSADNREAMTLKINGLPEKIKKQIIALLKKKKINPDNVWNLSLFEVWRIIGKPADSIDEGEVQEFLKPSTEHITSAKPEEFTKPETGTGPKPSAEMPEKGKAEVAEIGKKVVAKEELQKPSIQHVEIAKPEEFSKPQTTPSAKPTTEMQEAGKAEVGIPSIMNKRIMIERMTNSLANIFYNSLFKSAEETIKKQLPKTQVLPFNPNKILEEIQEQQRKQAFEEIERVTRELIKKQRIEKDASQEIKKLLKKQRRKILRQVEKRIAEEIQKKQVGLEDKEGLETPSRGPFLLPAKISDKKEEVIIISPITKTEINKIQELVKSSRDFKLRSQVARIIKQLFGIEAFQYFYKGSAWVPPKQTTIASPYRGLEESAATSAEQLAREKEEQESELGHKPKSRISPLLSTRLQQKAKQKIGTETATETQTETKTQTRQGTQTKEATGEKETTTSKEATQTRTGTQTSTQTATQSATQIGEATQTEEATETQESTQIREDTDTETDTTGETTGEIELTGEEELTDEGEDGGGKKGEDNDEKKKRKEIKESLGAFSYIRGKLKAGPVNHVWYIDKEGKPQRAIIIGTPPEGAKNVTGKKSASLSLTKFKGKKLPNFRIIENTGASDTIIMSHNGRLSISFTGDITGSPPRISEHTPITEHAGRLSGRMPRISNRIGRISNRTPRLR